MRLCRLRNGRKKIILVDGPRYSGKSEGCLNAIPDHAWNVKDAAVNVLVPSIPAGSSSGVWNELVERVIPDWIAGNFGMDWAPVESDSPRSRKKYRPHQDGATKKLSCYVTNKFGTKSRIELNSLQDERDVEAHFHNRYFSMIYWPELSIYKKEATFNTILLSLRGVNFAQEDLVLLADSNPCPMLGKEHFVYKKWYEYRISDDIEPQHRDFQKSLHHVFISLDDNPYLSAQQKQDIRSTFAGDPDAYACYAEGKWIRAGDSQCLFINQFKRSLHVIESTDNPDDPDIALPEDGCSELICGWDIGEANHAWTLLEKCYATKEYENQQEQSIFKFIDELEFVGDDLSVAAFTEAVMRKRLKWHEYFGKPINWIDWSDRSALDQREAISDRFPADEVYATSGGSIKLMGVENIVGTLGPSIRLWRKLLFQQRLLFSAARCPKLIEMNTAIRRGAVPDTVAKQSPYKHIFDAGRYPIMKECWNELAQSVLQIRRQAQPIIPLISVRY